MQKKKKKIDAHIIFHSRIVFVASEIPHFRVEVSKCVLAGLLCNVCVKRCSYPLILKENSLTRDAEMSVQNLREKFNQPCNGAISPPGTSFGSSSSSSGGGGGGVKTTTTIKSEPSRTKTSNPFGPSINGKTPSHFRTNETSPSLSDCLLNNTPKPYVNGSLTTNRKSPEQSQQDIILRKWNRTSDFTNGTAKESTTTTTTSPAPWARNTTPSNESSSSSSSSSSLSSSPFSTLRTKPRNVVSRYISQLSLEGSAHDCDTKTLENGNAIPPDRAEQLKNKYEINSNGCNAAPTKPEPVTLNGGNGAAAKNVSSFLHGVRSKMNGDASNAQPNEWSSKSSTTASPLCNGLKKTPFSDKRMMNGGYEESQIKNTQTNKVLFPTQDYSALEKKYHTLQKDHDKLRREFKQKNDQLTHLRTLSEAMYKEYEQLRNQYNLETSTMHQAMERATQWYKQNRELKRQSTALMQHVIAMRPDALQEMGDEVDTYSEQDSEIEALRKTIQDLTREMSKLQTELNSIKRKENEAHEQITDLTQQLEVERRATKERRSNFETNNQDDNLEDKLRATEVDLQLALDRASQAEAETLTLSNKVSELENELQEIKNKATSAVPAPPAPPPPPPPPPLPATSSAGLNGIGNVVLRKSNGRAEHAEDSAAEQMADLLGIPKKTGIPEGLGGAIDDIINEIKGGRFSLKATEKQTCVKKEEPPPVVDEIRNVLGTLRRHPNRRRDCSVETTLDSRK